MPVSIWENVQMTQWQGAATQRGNHSSALLNDKNNKCVCAMCLALLYKKYKCCIYMHLVACKLSSIKHTLHCLDGRTDRGVKPDLHCAASIKHIKRCKCQLRHSWVCFKPRRKHNNRAREHDGARRTGRLPATAVDEVTVFAIVSVIGKMQRNQCMDGLLSPKNTLQWSQCSTGIRSSPQQQSEDRHDHGTHHSDPVRRSLWRVEMEDWMTEGLGACVCLCVDEEDEDAAADDDDAVVAAAAAAAAGTEAEMMVRTQSSLQPIDHTVRRCV